MPSSQTRPPALTASAGFGAVGAVLLLMGWLTGAAAVLVAAAGAAALSLVSALVWRSQLIEAWRKDHPKPQRRR
ncbi:MAG: hypothetical protein AB1673_11785 [Actinomycetota bacterium]